MQRTGEYESYINSQGLRDREYPYEKPTGTFRILVIGDYFDVSRWNNFARTPVYLYRVGLGLTARLAQQTDDTLIDTAWGQVLPIYRAEPQPREVAAWQLTGFLLERMMRATSEANARLLIAHLTEVFTENVQATSFYFPIDGHFNADGTT